MHKGLNNELMITHASGGGGKPGTLTSLYSHFSLPPTFLVPLYLPTNLELLSHSSEGHTQKPYSELSLCISVFQ